MKIGNPTWQTKVENRQQWNKIAKRNKNDINEIRK